jgi:hypothetical protein
MPYIYILIFTFIFSLFFLLWVAHVGYKRT